MKTNYTPGPWAFCNDTLCQATGNYFHLGVFIESPGLGKAAEANKALIAAAPELKAALEALCELAKLRGGHLDEYKAAVAYARAALAKAEGKA